MTRNAATRSKKILVLTPQFPYPPHQGTTIRNFNLIVGLAQANEVHLLSFGNQAQIHDSPLHGLCRSVRIVQPPQRSMGQRVAGLFFSRLPDMAQRLPSPTYQAALDSTLKQEKPDVVEVEGIELAQYLFQVAESRGRPGKPLLVFDDHNAEYVLQQRIFETDIRRPLRWPGAIYSWIQWKKLERYEA
ncbi:MAG: glycosyl transferase family 1, partial [Anaerolineae bacterium]